jgi:hypothetical protein
MNREPDLNDLDVAARRQLRRLYSEAMDGPPPGVEARVLGPLADAGAGPRRTWLAPVAAATLGLLVVVGLLAVRHDLGTRGTAGSAASAAATNAPPATPHPSPSGATAAQAHPIPCRLPLDINDSGAFIDITDRPMVPGVYSGPQPFPDPAGHPLLPDGEDPIRVSYDWTVGRWLPVSPAWVAPDGASYAWSDRKGALHVDDTLTGRDRRLNGDRVWVVLSFRPEGVYAGELTAGATVPSGLWLVNASTGQARQLQSSGPWEFVAGGAAWAMELRSPAPSAPPWASYPDGRYGNTLVRLDLASGRTATVYAVSDMLLRLVGVDAQGDPMIMSLRSSVSSMMIVVGPGRLRTTGSGSWIDAVTDGNRTWFTDSYGPSLWVKDASRFAPEPEFTSRSWAATPCACSACRSRSATPERRRTGHPQESSLTTNFCRVGASRTAGPCRPAGAGPPRARTPSRPQPVFGDAGRTPLCRRIVAGSRHRTRARRD